MLTIITSVSAPTAKLAFPFCALLLTVYACLRYGVYCCCLQGMPVYSIVVETMPALCVLTVRSS